MKTIDALGLLTAGLFSDPTAERSAPQPLIGEPGLARHRQSAVGQGGWVRNFDQAHYFRLQPSASCGPLYFGTKVERLVAAEFADPKRLAALGVGRFVRFAAVRGLQVRRPVAERLVGAARDALTTAEAAVARDVLAADLALLTELSAQIGAAEAELARLRPLSPFATLTTTPGWGVVRAGNYAAALGNRHRWPGSAQIYRASGLSPAQYESAG
jgi:transposase